jgi:hypothetical protein
MFGMFQRRDQRSQAGSGDYLVSFISMNRGGHGLSAREKLAVARRIETASPLDNPLSALDVHTPVHDGVALTPAPAFILPVSAPPTQPNAEQSGPVAGGLTW